MTFHKDMPSGARHAPYNWIWADETARTAESVTSDDLYKTGLQLDTFEVYILTAATPTWTLESGDTGVTTNIYTADGTIDTDTREITMNNGASLDLEAYDNTSSDYDSRGHFALGSTQSVFEWFEGNGSGGSDGAIGMLMASSGFFIYDSVNSKGLEYTADYSDNFDDRSIIDKAYADSISLQESNLTWSATQRTIDLFSSAELDIEAYDTSDSSTYTERMKFDITPDQLDIQFIAGNGSGGSTGLHGLTITDTAITWTDTINEKGMSYAADYSANFDDRSIPDVDWVRSNVFPRFDAGGDETLTLSGMSNSDFDGDYEEMTNYGTTGASSQFDFSTTHKSFYRVNDAGTTWYIVLYSTSGNNWEVIDSITDPETWTDGEDLSSLVSNTETFTSNSDTDDGLSIPDAGDSNVSYDAKADMHIDTDLFLDGKVLRFYHGNTGSASPVELMAFRGDHSGNELNPYLQFPEGFDVGNNAFINMGKGSYLKWNDGTKSVDAFEIIAEVNGSDVFQNMAFDSHVTEFNWYQMGNMNWYISDASGNRTWSLYDGDEDNSPSLLWEITNDDFTFHKAIIMDSAHFRWTCRTTVDDQWRIRTDGDDLVFFYYDDSETTSTDIATFTNTNLSLEFPSDFGVQFDHVGGASAGYWRVDHNSSNDNLELCHFDGTDLTVYLEIDDDTLAANFHGDVTAESFDLHPYQVVLGDPSSNGVVIALDDGSTVPSEVQLALDTIEIDNSSIYTLSSNAITVLKDGKFQVNIGILIDETNSNGGQRARVEVYMKKNGVQVAHSIGATYFRELTPGTGISVSFIEDVSENDILTFWALCEPETSTDPPNMEQGETHVSLLQVGP